MSYLEEMLNFTEAHCTECSSIYKMERDDDKFYCPECYRSIGISQADFNWSKLYNYIIKDNSINKIMALLRYWKAIDDVDINKIIAIYQSIKDRGDLLMLMGYHP